MQNSLNRYFENHIYSSDPDLRQQIKDFKLAVSNAFMLTWVLTFKFTGIAFKHLLPVTNIVFG